MHASSSPRGGFTVVELVVAIAIIGLLLALILPAVQQAREAARRTQCRNHLRQIGLAVHTHVELHGHFPTDGWGYLWVGDPDRGFGEDQPGGWVFNVLPYLEQQALRTLGTGQPEPDKRVAANQRRQTALAVFHCPSRRSASPYPYTLTSVELRNADHGPSAKSDFAINGGDLPIDAGPGPESASPQDLAAWTWPDLHAFTGISFVRSRIRPHQVRDGLSVTYLAGEKSVPRSHYTTGGVAGDDQTMYVGDDADIRRWTDRPPLPDAADVDDKRAFGSAHAAGCHFLMCDGAVRMISYSIDSLLHERLGNRRDGAAIDESSL